MLKKNTLDTLHIIQWNKVTIEDYMSYKEQPVRILAKELEVLCNREILFVKVLWEHHKEDEATREIEIKIYEKYPHLFNFQLEVVL